MTGEPGSGSCCSEDVLYRLKQSLESIFQGLSFNSFYIQTFRVLLWHFIVIFTVGFIPEEFPVSRYFKKP